jgi:hypothetical protein
MVQFGYTVFFSTAGEVTAGNRIMTVPGVGKLVGSIEPQSADDATLVFKAVIDPRPPFLPTTTKTPTLF